MGRRKVRRKLAVKPAKKLPRIFQCPHCGMTSVNVILNRKEKTVTVICSNCGLEAAFNVVEGYLPVDYFNKFADKYYAGEIKPKKEGVIPVVPQVSNNNQKNGESDKIEGVEYEDFPVDDESSDDLDLRGDSLNNDENEKDENEQ
ncbi:MAG: hypothetical protein ACP5NY_01895 [Thermocladium sp.]